ncbi:MAG: hypothetical protein ACI93T_001150 [Porticoccaceae bacterium]|jgi:hypothetical protein
MPRSVVLILILLAPPAILLLGGLRRESVAPTPLEKLKACYEKKHVPTADHAKFPALQREFSSTQDVMQACISWHTERGHEVMASSHFRARKD